MRTDESGFWSKALGFGFDEPVTAELIEEVCAFYRDAGTPRAVLQLAPSVLPADWSEICAKSGLTADCRWVVTETGAEKPGEHNSSLHNVQLSHIWDTLPDVGQDLDGRLAQRLAELRMQRGWSLDELSGHSGVSRSTLSRLERAEISPTTAVLSQLCAAYGRTASQLLAEVEDESPQLLRPDQQPVWRDDDAGFVRRSVSPPQPGMRGEVVECTLRPGADIVYSGTPVPGLEQHIWVLDGTLELTLDDHLHVLAAGDCLRFRLWGPSRFRCPAGESVCYALVVVLP